MLMLMLMAILAFGGDSNELKMLNFMQKMSDSGVDMAVLFLKSERNMDNYEKIYNKKRTEIIQEYKAIMKSAGKTISDIEADEFIRDTYDIGAIKNVDTLANCVYVIDDVIRMERLSYCESQLRKGLKILYEIEKEKLRQ